MGDGEKSSALDGRCPKASSRSGYGSSGLIAFILVTNGFLGFQRDSRVPISVSAYQSKEKSYSILVR